MNRLRIVCAALAAVAFLLGGEAHAQQATACDVDADSDIDRNDVSLIVAARNQPASGTDDPRDPDRDLLITVSDARICTLRCTLAQCAVPPANRAPIADAGADQSVMPGATVTLNGSASSDPDGDALQFQWTLRVHPAGSAAVLDDATAVLPSFVADAEGQYEIDLVVNDGRIDSVPDTVIVTTLPANTAPVANAGSDRNALVGELVILDGGLSSDADGDLLSFHWEFVTVPLGSAVTLVSPESVQANFVPDTPGEYIVRLIVEDGRGGAASDDVRILTQPGNQPPTADAGPDQAIAVGELVTLDGSGSADPDGDPLSYQWSFVTRPTNSTASLSNSAIVDPTFVADVAGEYVLQLIVNDGQLDSAADTVLVTSSNTPPVADAGPDQTATVGDVVEFDGNGSSDANGDALGFFWSILARPSGSSAELTNPLSPTPTLTPDVAGPYLVQLIVNDGTIDSAPDTALVTVEPPPNGDPIASLDAISTPFDTAVLIPVLANDTDPDGDVLSITAVTTPIAGTAVIEGQEIRYTPNATFSGLDIFEYTVSDGRGGFDTGFVHVTVDREPGTVTVVTSDSRATEFGDAGAFTISRTGPVTDALTVSYTLLGSATNGVDYQTLSSSVVIPAGAASAVVEIVPVADSDVEGTESVLLLLNPGPEYIVGIPGIASLSITDSIVVTVTAADAQGSEADLDTASFIITRAGDDLTQPLNVGVSFSGAVNRLNSNDATLTNVVAGGLVVIPAGQASTIVTVTPNRDNVVEGTEDLVLTLATSPGYVVGTPSSATITILDDPAIVTIVASDAAASEAGLDPGTFTMTRSGGDIASALTVFCSFASSTAQNSGDFNFTGCSATIPANQLSGTLTITPRADNAVEGDETVVATLTPAAAATYVIGTPSSATITIADDPVIVTLTASDADAAEEGNDPGTFTFTRSGGNFANALVITFSRGGTATQGQDYSGIPISITIPANAPAATLTITPIDDSLTEATESVTLTLLPSPSFIAAAPGAATVNITDND